MVPVLSLASTMLRVAMSRALAWKRAPGVYDGNVVVTGATGQTETIAVHLIITQVITPHTYFLPLLARK